MDLETRLALIRGVGEEIVTGEELRALLETKSRPIAYDGFEPSGIAHLPIGVFRPLLIKDLIKANVHFKLLIADSFAWINNKLGGDLEKIRDCGRYFIEVWRAAGVDMDKVEVIWHKEHFDNPEYWKKVILIAKQHSLTRTMRALTIAGRVGSENNPAAFTFYPSMQCADIFQLECDICQLGLDQRKVNMLAREVGPAIGYWKPVVVGHHMLLGLSGPQEAAGFDEQAIYDRAISSKMSKSKPETSIFVHDSREAISRKIRAAYCPEKVVEDNPILDYSRNIVFRAFKSMQIERPSKFGGNLELHSYAELEEVYHRGDLHPLDLKLAVAYYIDKLIAPVREHFEKDKKAKELYEFVRGLEVTR